MSPRLQSGAEEALEDRPVGRQPASRWAVAIIAATWAWICVPKVIQTILSPKYRVDLGGEAPYSKLAALADHGFYYALIGVCVLAILTVVTDLPRTGGLQLACLLAPWAYMVVRDLYVPTKPSHEAICYPLIVVALWTTRAQLRDLRLVGYLIATTALISMAIALVMPSHAIFQTQSGELIATDKQVLPLGVLVGIFTQGNTLGQFLAVGLPAVFLIANTRTRALLAFFTIFALVWTASRGSMISIVIGFACWCILRGTKAGARQTFAWLVPIAMSVVITVVPFITSDTRSFSNRGLVWIFSLQAWSGSPWTGLGVNWYSIIGSTSDRLVGSAFHGHNQVVHFLVTGGIILTVLVLIQVMYATIRASNMARSGSLFGSVWLTVLIASGLFERTFSYVDNGNFLLTVAIPFAFLMFGAAPAIGARAAKDQPILRTGSSRSLG